MGCLEVRIGFLSMLANVKPFDLFFFADAESKSDLDGEEDDQAGNEGKGGNTSILPELSPLQGNAG